MIAASAGTWFLSFTPTYATWRPTITTVAPSITCSPSKTRTLVMANAGSPGFVALAAGAPATRIPANPATHTIHLLRLIAGSPSVQRFDVRPPGSRPRSLEAYDRGRSVRVHVPVRELTADNAL